jgi:excisionase family DNA binding protein
VTLEEALETMLAKSLATLHRELAALRSEVKALTDRLPTPQRQLLTVPAAAKQLGVCEATIRRHIKAGLIPIVPVGKSIRIDLEQLRSFDRQDVMAELRERGL